MGVLGAKWGKIWCDVDPSKLVFTFGVLKSVPVFEIGENRSRRATIGVSIDGYTH